MSFDFKTFNFLRLLAMAKFDAAHIANTSFDPKHSFSRQKETSVPHPKLPALLGDGLLGCRRNCQLAGCLLFASEIGVGRHHDVKYDM